MRWYEAGREGRRRSRSFAHKADARLFEAELMRRRALGEFAFLEAPNKRVEDLARDWWEISAKPTLAYNTLDGYAPALDKHVLPRLGSLKLRDVTPEVLGRFRADLEKTGVARSSVRISLVVIQAMFSRAQEWGWVANNPARAVRKPSGARQRAVVCLEPARVEDIRNVMLAQERQYAALMVSLAAYAGLRIPEEVLALERRHIHQRTLLVEQRLIEGEIVAGQRSDISALAPSTSPPRSNKTLPSTDSGWGDRKDSFSPPRRTTLATHRRQQLAAPGLAWLPRQRRCGAVAAV